MGRPLARLADLEKKRSEYGQPPSSRGLFHSPLRPTRFPAMTPAGSVTLRLCHKGTAPIAEACHRTMSCLTALNSYCDEVLPPALHERRPINSFDLFDQCECD